MSIAVYRSSFPIAKWDLNDDDFNLTKAVWENRPADPALPQQASPGSEVAWPESGKPADYKEPTRAGFEFAGWSTNKSASAGGYIDGKDPVLTMPEGAPEAKEYTLYALWTPNEYAVVFDLAKNPLPGKGPLTEDSFKLNWDTDTDLKRTVTPLGDGRFNVSGFTMKEADYDSVTKTVGLPVPARSGYRFLGWVEPAEQGAVIDNADKSGYVLNPVRLTQIDGTPVLVARWAAAFGVTAPISITFGDYDKTGAPGNPWLGDAATEAKAGEAADDATQSEADDTAKGDQEGYEALGQAYFENTGWDLNVSIVKVESARAPSANQVLTTFDSSKATEAQVLGGTDGEGAEHEGERLLSMYPLAAVPEDAAERKEKGVHFRLDDTVAEGAGSNLGAFVIAGKTYESEDHKLPVSFGLNLSTDPVDGSANHGLVLPANDYERKQIATVSYTFAQTSMVPSDPTKHNLATGSTSDALYIEYNGKVYGLSDIKDAADCIAVLGTGSPCYPLYRSFFQSGMDPSDPADPHGYVRWGDGATYSVRIIGIRQDAKTGGGLAGLTFQFVDCLNATYRAHSVDDNSVGWSGSELRSVMNSGTIWQQVPAKLAAAIPSVYHTNLYGARTTHDKLFLASYHEMTARDWSTDKWSTLYPEIVLAGTERDTSGPYQYYDANHLNISGADLPQPQMIKKVNGVATPWWLRNIDPNNKTGWGWVGESGDPHHGIAKSAVLAGVVPCFAL